MEKKQYIVQVHGTYKREKLFDYIINNYNLKICFSKEYMVNSVFPFVIDFAEKKFWVCESVTCCACAAQNNNILSLEDFYKKIK